MLSKQPSRRDLLRFAGAAAAVAATRGSPAQPAERPKVAVVFTEFRLRSHAYNFLHNLLGPYLFRGKWTEPGVEVVSFYADQFPEQDMARDVSRKFGIPLFPSIDQALCLGGKQLGVDAVLVVGEHGDYPFNELGQHLYPRKEFFDQCVAVMRRSDRFVPLFNDKHLSYRWDLAKGMYDEAKKLGIPLMAGSSVPLGSRHPQLDLPEDCQIEEAVAVHGGGMEVYGFHGLELLQSFIEARRGGETGITRVQLLAGKAYEQAAAEGLWSRDLAEAAMNAERAGDFPRQPRKVPPPAKGTDKPTEDHAIVVTYKDGTRGTVLRLGSDSNRWNFACRLKGEAKPRATAIYNGPWGNLNLFNALTNAIIHFVKTGKSPYPVERTLLTGGAIDAAMHSHHAGGKAIDTPQLTFTYPTVDFARFRETGASWPLLKDVPSPTSFSPGPPR
jgi:hypothetical protein